MPTTGSEHDGPGGHIGLLRSPTPQCRDRIHRWLHAAVARGDKVATVAVPAGLPIGGHAHGGSGIDGAIDLGGLPVLTPAELRREAQPARLSSVALAEGYRGLGVLIWADGSIAAVSPQGHAAVETSLAALCREHPVSVLCVYDRGGAGTRQLDMAVTHHPDELRDQQAFVHHDRHRLALGGEFDLSNLDVLSTASPPSAPPVLRRPQSPPCRWTCGSCSSSASPPPARWTSPPPATAITAAASSCTTRAPTSAPFCTCSTCTASPGSPCSPGPREMTSRGDDRALVRPGRKARVTGRRRGGCRIPRCSDPPTPTTS